MTSRVAFVALAVLWSATGVASDSGTGPAGTGHQPEESAGGGTGAAGVRAAATHSWPVLRDVVDPFRPPATPWGAGNRGWEFATVAGDPVVAPAPGGVTFAGPVAGRGVVSVDLGGGLVWSLTGLATVEVSVGDQVSAGARVGTASPGLHLGYRRWGDYVDPALFLPVSWRARLVPLGSAGR